MLKEERALLSFLIQKEEKERNSEKTIAVIDNIDQARFRAIFREFQHQLQDSGYPLKAFEIDFNLFDYRLADMDLALTMGKAQSSRVMVLVEGVNALKQLNNL